MANRPSRLLTNKTIAITFLAKRMIYMKSVVMCGNIYFTTCRAPRNIIYFALLKCHKKLSHEQL